MNAKILFLTVSIFGTINAYAQCEAYFLHSANWDTLTFTNVSVAANAHYYWNFGDGSTSYETSPVHVFVEAGTFLVTMHVLDTIDHCHSFHQEWLPVSRPYDAACEPYMTDSLFNLNGTDYLKVTDQAAGCIGLLRHIDAMGSQNATPNNWIGFGNWGQALTMARLRYTSYDSISGIQFRRAYYRSLPYNVDPSTSYDTCSADFEYFIDYQSDGAVVTFKPLGSSSADTVWVTGFGNPIPLVGPVSSFTFPYGGPQGRWQNVWRRNHDTAHGCLNRMSHTLIIRDPFYIAPPTCEIGAQPEHATVVEHGTAQFIIVTEPGSIKQWQQNTGLGWMDLFDAGPYSGVNTDTLTILNSQTWWSGDLYRCKVRTFGNNCFNTSSVASLNVIIGPDQAGIRIHPNPATDLLHVHWVDVQGPIQVTVHDALGRQVMKRAITGNTESLDLSAISSGTYMISVTSGERAARSRFIKQ